MVRERVHMGYGCESRSGDRLLSSSLSPLVGKATKFSLTFSPSWITNPRLTPMVGVDLPSGGCTPIWVRLPTGRNPCFWAFIFYKR